MEPTTAKCLSPAKANHHIEPS